METWARTNSYPTVARTHSYKVLCKWMQDKTPCLCKQTTAWHQVSKANENRGRTHNSSRWAPTTIHINHRHYSKWQQQWMGSDLGSHLSTSRKNLVTLWRCKLDNKLSGVVAHTRSKLCRKRLGGSLKRAKGWSRIRIRQLWSLMRFLVCKGARPLILCLTSQWQPLSLPSYALQVNSKA